jgi:hypothetical protein
VSIIEKLKDIGVDPIRPLPLCAAEAGVSTQTLKFIAKRSPDLLQIIRVSERRCGVRESVWRRFLESRKSAVSPVASTTPRQALGAAGKAKRQAVEAA